MVDHNMVSPGESILVGVSGGVDSVTLLWCLLRLAEKFSVARIGVAHLNHGLRGQAADDDMAFVMHLADIYGLTCHLETVDVAGFAEKGRLSIEDAARRLRYGFFNNTALTHGYDKIATAHHADDNAEQVLMGLLRGSGPKGLSGIPPVREGRIIRPFINLARADIEAVASREKIEFITDDSNNNLRFLRNQVRHELIPYLQKSYNINITDNLNQLADISRQEDTWQEELVAAIFSNLLLVQSADEVVLSVSLLKEQPRAVQRRLVRKALAVIKGDLQRITFAHIEAIIHTLDKKQSTLDMPGRIVAAKSDDRLIFCPASSWQEIMAGKTFSYTLFARGAANDSLVIPEIDTRIDFSVMARKDVDDITAGGANVALWDLEQITFPLTVRNILPGDRFVPLGMKGHQKLKDFFINHKTSREQRCICPVVVSGEEIVWLAGFRVADGVKITSATTRVLKAELVGPDMPDR